MYTLVADAPHLLGRAYNKVTRPPGVPAIFLLSPAAEPITSLSNSLTKIDRFLRVAVCFDSHPDMGYGFPPGEQLHQGVVPVGFNPDLSEQNAWNIDPGAARNSLQRFIERDGG